MRIHRCSQRYFGVEQLDQRLRHGLVGYWKFNEGSGLTAQDLSGKRNHGTLINGPKWSLGREHIGNALSFDGVDDYVDCGNDVSLDIGGEDFTLEFWGKFEPDAKSENDVISNGTGTNGNWLLMVYNKKLRGHLWTSDGGSNVINSTINVDDGLWHQFLQVVSSDQIILYIDGVENNRQTLTASKVSLQQTVFIGSRSGTTTFAKGLIDEVRIYNRALSPAEIVLFASPSFSPVVPVRRHIEEVITHIRGWWSK